MSTIGNVVQRLINDPVFQAETKLQHQKLKMNELIVKQDSINHHLFLIKSGKVRVIVGSSRVEGMTPIRSSVIDLVPGDTFGEFALYDDSPASADVITTTETEVIAIDIALLRKYLDTHLQIKCEVLEEMFKALVKRLRHADKAIINLYAWGIWHT